MNYKHFNLGLSLKRINLQERQKTEKKQLQEWQAKILAELESRHLKEMTLMKEDLEKQRADWSRKSDRGRKNQKSLKIVHTSSSSHLTADIGIQNQALDKYSSQNISTSTHFTSATASIANTNNLYPNNSIQNYQNFITPNSSHSSNNFSQQSSSQNSNTHSQNNNSAACLDDTFCNFIKSQLEDDQNFQENVYLPYNTQLNIATSQGSFEQANQNLNGSDLDLQAENGCFQADFENQFDDIITYVINNQN